MVQKIIGLCGTNASGKSVVGAHLEKKGFVFMSLSNMIRKEIARLGLTESRDTLFATGNKLREEGGAGVLGVKMKEHILENPTQNFVVDSIRQPAEVEALSTLEGFSLFAFDADNKTMNMAKATVLNNTTLDDFLSAATVAIKEHAGVEL